jgi:hypothetical protein
VAHSPLNDPGVRPHRQRQNGPLDKIFVRDLVLPCFVGIFDDEKDNRQRVRFNVEMSIYPSRRRNKLIFSVL